MKTYTVDPIGTLKAPRHFIRTRVLDVMQVVLEKAHHTTVVLGKHNRSLT